MDKTKILDNRRKSLSSVSVDGSIGVELTHSARPLPVTDLRATLDQYQVFMNERNACRKYRLILTINPFCSNVLFNTLTEIVKNEGDDRMEFVAGSTKAKRMTDVLGPNEPDRYQMIRNTEYSKESLGYVYRPGFDFFNNHILRNKTFKVVNNLTDSSTIKKEVFNTLADYQRYANGEKVVTSIRESLDKVKDNVERHLYGVDDVMSFSDSVNANLMEDNGWFGFVNSSTINPKKGGVIRDRDGNTAPNMDINRPLNNHRNCEFIDMFPDRSLFSFNPKFNSYKHRAEYNWNFCLTYPFSKRFDHTLVRSVDKLVNGLLIQSIRRVDGLRGGDAIIVRTYTPHGLKRGDSVRFYYTRHDDRDYRGGEKSYIVNDIGDVDKENKSYFFHITDMSLLVDILGNGFGYDANGNWIHDSNDTNTALEAYCFRMSHFVNGKASEYYIRKFRKIPNLRRRNYDLDEETASDPSAFNRYIEENAMKNGTMLPFNNEQYQLAFESTIYNDNSTQVTFTDTIDIEYLKDHLGRPLSEIFVTIVKNNQGYKKIYRKGDPNDYKDDDVEYSSCFGRISSGIDVFNDGSREDSDTRIRNKRAALGDIHLLNELGWYGATSLTNGDISISDDMFDGDVAEFIPYDAREVVLADIMHRFNTAQRELTTEELMNLFGDSSSDVFTFDEIVSDDYDKDGFMLERQELQNNTFKPEGSRGAVTECDAVRRPEGYYYKPHHRIGLAEFGSVRQASHHDIKIRRLTPKQCYNNMNVQVVTKSKHNLSAGDIVYVCDDVLGAMYARNVVAVTDPITIVIDIMEKDDRLKEIGWYGFCNIANGMDEKRKFVFRRKNKEIPSHAIKAGVNRYLWRPLAYNSDDDGTIEDFVYTNGHLYLHKMVNFFLKRQDPHGYNGLYNATVFPNDIVGNTKSESSYEYIEESENVC